MGRGAGRPTLSPAGAHQELLLTPTVVAHYNVARLQEALHQLAPETAIDVSTVDNSLVLNGTVFSAAEGEDVRRIAARFVPDASQLVNKMQVDAPNQVNLRVRVAEMSRETIKAFGFNWENVFGSGNFLFGLATGNPVLAAGTVLPSPNTARQFLTRPNGVNSVTATYLP